MDWKKGNKRVHDLQIGMKQPLYGKETMENEYPAATLVIQILKKVTDLFHEFFQSG